MPPPPHPRARWLALPLLLSWLAPTSSQWSCPPSGAVPRAFRDGYFTAGDSSIALGADAVFVAAGGDRVPAARCVLRARVEAAESAAAPPRRVWLDYAAAGARNGSTAGCALLDVSSPGAVQWSEALAPAPCPLAATAAYGGWSQPAPPPWTCAGRPPATPIPAALQGVGRPGGAADPAARLYVSAGAWSVVADGVFVAPGCAAAVADAGAGVTAITLSARGDGRAEACLWARPAGASSLDVKWGGVGAACPTDFAGAVAVPFAFAPATPAAAPAAAR